MRRGHIGCCCSSVVERVIGNDEVDSSILSSSTIFSKAEHFGSAGLGTFRHVRRTIAWGEFYPDGVIDIEMRLWVAYGLIALMLAAAVAGIAYFRHNRHDQKYLRQRQREDRKSRDREEAAKRSDAVN